RWARAANAAGCRAANQRVKPPPRAHDLAGFPTARTIRPSVCPRVMTRPRALIPPPPESCPPRGPRRQGGYARSRQVTRLSGPPSPLRGEFGGRGLGARVEDLSPRPLSEAERGDQDTSRGARVARSAAQSLRVAANNLRPPHHQFA